MGKQADIAYVTGTARDVVRQYARIADGIKEAGLPVGPTDRLERSIANLATAVKEFDQTQKVEPVVDELVQHLQGVIQYDEDELVVVVEEPHIILVQSASGPDYKLTVELR